MRVAIGKIARAVNGLGIAILQGVLYEGLGGLFGIAEISERHAGAAQIDLSHFPVGGSFSVLGQQKQVGIAEGAADRNGLSLLKRAVRAPIAGHSRGLGGAVKIKERGVRQSLSPKAVLLRRKDLTAKGNGAKVARRILFQHPERGDHGQCRHDPADRVDAMLVEKIAEAHREGKERLWNKISRGTKLDDGHQLL